MSSNGSFVIVLEIVLHLTHRMLYHPGATTIFARLVTSSILLTRLNLNNNDYKTNNNEFMNGRCLMVWTLTNPQSSPRSNWKLEVLVHVTGGIPENPEKNPQNRD